MRINIYLEKDERTKLEKLKYKYHLSYSTIARIILDGVLFHGKELWNEIYDHYIYDKKGYKTSIKPRQYLQINKPSIVYTNVVKMFLKKDFIKYIPDQKKVDNLYNKIYDQFTKEYDQDWNGSYIRKSLTKYIKENPEYIKKLLESQD